MMIQKHVFVSPDSDLASCILLISIEGIFCDNDLVVTTKYLYIYTCMPMRMHSIVLFCLMQDIEISNTMIHSSHAHIIVLLR